MARGWNFPSNNYGESAGFGEAGIETFKGSLFSSLAREICQNSLDARLDNSKPVKIEIILSEVSKNKIPGINELKKALNSCREYSEKANAIKFFENAVDICNSDTVRVLRISDYNTTGLTGSSAVKSSPWLDLVKSSGVSNKGGDQGGSFGIGKKAPFACSDLRTVFYNTLDKYGEKAYQGVARLISFPTLNLSNGESELTQGNGYYGELQHNSAIKELIHIDEYVRTEVGTDVFILGFINHSEWETEVIKSVIDGYLISILHNQLEVVVNNTVINSETLKDLIDEYQKDIPLAHNYYQVLTSEKTVCIVEDFQGLGELELRILIEKDFKRKVLMARNSGMKILDKQNISSAIQFAGVCILKDKDLNEYFREMENPQHNDWEPDRYSDDEILKKEAKKRKQALFKFVKDKVLEVGRTTVSDEMDAVGAGEFVPDIDVTSGEDVNKIESISNEIKDYTPIKKIENLKIERGSQVVEDNDVESDELTLGGIQEDGDLPTPEYNHNNGSQGENAGENVDGHGNYTDDGNIKMPKTIAVKPLKLRVFLCNAEEKMYKLSFTPDRSAKNAYVEISIAGEQSNLNVEILEAKLPNNCPIVHNKNRILIGDIEANKPFSVMYSIKYNELCSMGVVVYGYKI